MIGKVVGQIARLRAAASQVLRIAIELEAGSLEDYVLDEPRAQPARKIWRDLDRTIIHQKVTELYRARRRRSRHLPAELFGEPAWDMLLDLFAARLDGRLISVTSACYAAGVPPTTALRWLGVLEKAGLVERIDHTSDRRVWWVRLSEPGLQQMCAYFEDLLASLEADTGQLVRPFQGSEET